METIRIQTVDYTTGFSRDTLAVNLVLPPGGAGIGVMVTSAPRRRDPATCMLTPEEFREYVARCTATMAKIDVMLASKKLVIGLEDLEKEAPR